MAEWFTLLSSLLKYIFITIIYLFIFGIMRMIFLDIRKMDGVKIKEPPKGEAYLRLLTDKTKLYFEVEDIYPLKKDVVIIGRAPECEITIDDLYMSSQHVQLWHEDNEWYIADMGSKNGTYINDIKMGESPLILDKGDKIKVGQVEFLVVI